MIGDARPRTRAVLARVALIPGLACITACAREPRSPPELVILTRADSLAWAPRASLPTGALSVVLDGDPAGPGSFTVRMMLPAGFRLPPHYHASAERLTVLSGSIHLGYGNALDTAASQYLPAGAYAVNPARLRHYSWTSEPAVVQVTGEGPWVLHYVRPRDDPRIGIGPP